MMAKGMCRGIFGILLLLQGCRCHSFDLLEVRDSVRIHSVERTLDLGRLDEQADVVWAEVVGDDHLFVHAGRHIRIYTWPRLTATGRIDGVEAAGRTASGAAALLRFVDGGAYLQQVDANGAVIDNVRLEQRAYHLLEDYDRRNNMAHLLLSYNATDSLVAISLTFARATSASSALAIFADARTGRMVGRPYSLRDVFFIFEDELYGNWNDTLGCRLLRLSTNGDVSQVRPGSVGQTCIWSRAAERKALVHRKRSMFIPLAQWAPIYSVPTDDLACRLSVKIGVTSKVILLNRREAEAIRDHRVQIVY